jgi:hypothetical protein
MKVLNLKVADAIRKNEDVNVYAQDKMENTQRLQRQKKFKARRKVIFNFFQLIILIKQKNLL